MAFKSSFLRSVASAGCGPLWAYRTMDDPATVVAGGYFNPAKSNLSVGDLICVTQVTDLGAANEGFVSVVDCRVTAVAPDVVVVIDHDLAVGGYNTGSLLASLGLYDPLRWHQWFHDFVAEPSYHMDTYASGWQYMTGFQQWSVYSPGTGTETVERNNAVGVCPTVASWLQLITGNTLGDYIILAHNDAAGPSIGEAFVPFTSETKRYAVGFKVVFGDTTSVFRVGFWHADATFSTTLTDNDPGIFVQTAAGVATAYVKNYQFGGGKGAAFPITITYDITKAYEFEFLYDGAGTMHGQYRTFSAANPSDWISLGSVDMSTWQRRAGNFLIGPVMGALTTEAGISSHLGIDYMICAAER